MAEHTWYAVVFVEHSGRRLAIAKHGSLATAERIAKEWASGNDSIRESLRAQRIEIQRNPDRTIVWTSEQEQNDG